MQTTKLMKICRITGMMFPGCKIDSDFLYNYDTKQGIEIQRYLPETHFLDKLVEAIYMTKKSAAE